MKIEVFNEAVELHESYRLCEEVMKYLSDPDMPKGIKYTNRLKRFAEVFKDEFMAFVSRQMELTGMAFEELGACGCAKDPDDESTETENPKM